MGVFNSVKYPGQACRRPRRLACPVGEVLQFPARLHLYLDGPLEFMPFRIGFMAQAQQVGALNAVLVDGRFPIQHGAESRRVGVSHPLRYGIGFEWAKAQR